MVFAVVHPSCHLGCCLAYEFLAVKVANKVLCGRSAKRTSRIDVADKHPLILVGTAYTHLHKVGTFPHTTMIAILSTKLTLESPFL